MGLGVYWVEKIQILVVWKFKLINCTQGFNLDAVLSIGVGKMYEFAVEKMFIYWFIHSLSHGLGSLVALHKVSDAASNESPCRRYSRMKRKLLTRKKKFMRKSFGPSFLPFPEG